MRDVLRQFSSSDEEEEMEEGDSAEDLLTRAMRTKQSAQPMEDDDFTLFNFDESQSSEVEPPDLFIRSTDEEALWYSPESAASDLNFENNYVRGLDGPDNQSQLEEFVVERQLDNSSIFKELYKRFKLERAVILFSRYGLRLLARACEAYSSTLNAVSLESKDSFADISVLPPELFSMNSLQHFTLRGYGLKEFFLVDVYSNGLRNLQTLDLSRNKIRIVNESAFQLPALEVLILSDNELAFTEDHNNLFTACKNLKVIKLSRNNRLTVLPDSLLQLPKLLDLYLDDTSVRSLSDADKWVSNPVIEITGTPLSRLSERSIPFGMVHHIVVPDGAVLERQREDQSLNPERKRRRIGASLVASTISPSTVRTSGTHILSWKKK